MGYICDFVYLPRPYKSSGNWGYAFVNFLTADMAANFKEEFQGHVFVLQPKSTKRATVKFTEQCGLNASMEILRLKKSSKHGKPRTLASL